MMKEKDVYKCNVCGNVVEIMEVGGGTLVCCNQPMSLVQKDEGVAPVGEEKTHRPVIEVTGEKEIYVKIGEIAHPMTEEHYIQWIELSVDGSLYVKSLNPWDKPEAIFKVFRGKKMVARAKCNVHGVWKITMP